MSRILRYIQTTGDRVAILWVIGVVGLASFFALTMSGPFLWLIDFEVKTFGAHFPVITFLGLAIPPLPPEETVG